MTNLATPALKPDDATRVYVASFEDLRMTDVESVGGKNASLGEMISQLELSGINSATVKWNAANAYFGSLIVTFQDNRLVSRSQFGLR